MARVRQLGIRSGLHRRRPAGSELAPSETKSTRSSITCVGFDRVWWRSAVVTTTAFLATPRAFIRRSGQKRFVARTSLSMATDSSVKEPVSGAWAGMRRFPRRRRTASGCFMPRLTGSARQSPAEAPVLAISNFRISAVPDADRRWFCPVTFTIRYRGRRGVVPRGVSIRGSQPSPRLRIISCSILVEEPQFGMALPAKETRFGCGDRCAPCLCRVAGRAVRKEAGAVASTPSRLPSENYGGNYGFGCP